MFFSRDKSFSAPALPSYPARGKRISSSFQLSDKHFPEGFHDVLVFGAGGAVDKLSGVVGENIELVRVGKVPDVFVVLCPDSALSEQAELLTV